MVILGVAFIVILIAQLVLLRRMYKITADTERIGRVLKQTIENSKGEK